MTQEKKSWKDYFKLTKRTIIIISAGSALVVGGVTGGLIWHFTRPDSAEPPSAVEEVQPTVVNPDCEAVRLLDGVCVKSGEENLPVYGVMIENALDARPQFSVAQANLVFEAIAEGGITRFLVLYDSQKDLAKIGPVRSARTYYLEWAQEFNALYTHIGGSPESLELAKKRPIFDLDEFFNQWYFWRAKDRAAPHNVFTSTELLNQAVEKKQLDIKPEYKPWNFKDEATLEERGDLKKINVDFNSSYYSVAWQYDKETNEYTRYQGKAIHKDQDGAAIAVKNIAVMYTTSYVIAGDDKGRRFTQTVGTGKAFVFLDGQAIKGTWKRENLNERTRFYTEAGEEIAFNRGKTWVEVLPKDFIEVKFE